MTERKGIAKSVRFEVFKRDSFTCQYCGRRAPDVVLQADHIAPVSKGGDNSITNLITSCADCNAGKSDRLLDDATAIAKQQAQLASLQERREQIEMMMDWQRGLVNLDAETISHLAGFWSELVMGYTLNDRGLAGLEKLVKEFGAAEVCEAMRAAAGQYLEVDATTNEATSASVNKAWDYVGRICTVKRREKDKPYLRDLYYIRGILNKRNLYVNDWQCMELLERAVKAGIEVEELRQLAIHARNWSAWIGSVSELIENTTSS